jgi:membrane protease subunit (stomatin/prohibitin family)
MEYKNYVYYDHINNIVKYDTSIYRDIFIGHFYVEKIEDIYELQLEPEQEQEQEPELEKEIKIKKMNKDIYSPFDDYMLFAIIAGMGSVMYSLNSTNKKFSKNIDSELDLSVD